MRASLRLLAFCATALTGCYLSHTLDAPFDAGPARDGGPARDAGTRLDAGRDAGTDLGSPDACVPVAANASAIGLACSPDSAMCPAGYQCTQFSGAIVSYNCEIGCAADCECPAETRCVPVVDKAGTRLLCQPMPILI